MIKVVCFVTGPVGPQRRIGYASVPILLMPCIQTFLISLLAAAVYHLLHRMKTM
jgi:hypothetical protein